MRRLLALFALVLVGCGDGGHHFPGAPRSVAPGTVAGHPCDPAHYYQQCALRGQRLALTLPKQGAPSARGVDFAWGGPSCSSLKASGEIFGASYLSTDSSKNWSHGLFHDYVLHGCYAVFVWETGAGEATSGYNSGYSDARQALAQYRSYIPSGRVAITFAIDCDCSGAQVRSYFQGADAYLRPNAGNQSVNAYGGYYPLRDLCSWHLVGSLNWQTYAWSGGQWLPSSCAPLEQWLNDGHVDYDWAISPDYGQYPPPSSPPAPRVRCLHQPYPKTHSCGRVRYGYSVTQRDRAKVLSRLAEHHCGARIHPSYCRGWAHSLAVDDKTLSDFVRLYG